MVSGFSFLDFTDRKILFSLDQNSRKSFAQIGKETRMSKQAVKFRVERLLNRGIIESFNANWNLPMLGYENHNLYCRFRKTNPEKEKELIEKLQKNKHVNWLASVDGQYDLIIGTQFKSINEFSAFQHEIIYNYDDIIQKRDIMSITNLFHFRRYYLTNSKAQKIEFDEFIAPRKSIKLDDLDKKILSFLVENAREKATNIAKIVGVTAETVNNRTKAMLNKGIIQSFFLKLNHQAMGVQFYKIIFFLKQLTEKRKRELTEFCAVHPNIIYVVEGIGIGDVQLDVEVESREALSGLLSLLREKFADIINDYELLTISKEIKAKYSLPE